ncbi:hypothetical protein LINGRAHAP2_LOCUS33505 [Linum grandiflorum]
MNSSVRLINGLLLVLAITTTATLVSGDTPGDVPYGQCDNGKSGVDMPTVVWLKSSLINDLMATVPSKDGLHYCNTDSSGGITMYGYAECTRKPPPSDLRYCTDCLALVGNYIAGAGSCDDSTGVSHAWDSDSLCYFKIGFTLATCPVV